MHWAQAIINLQAHGSPYCLVTVMDVKGSSPREVGAKMVVSESHSFATIGGGALEYAAINLARDFINTPASKPQLQTFDLSKDLQQCCGGVVSLLFENCADSMADLVVFGAGHVGSALIAVLANLDFRIRWFDSRTELFPAQLPPNVRTYTLQQLDLEVDSCPKGAYYLVMTHDHALDQALCEAVLSRGDAAFCGLIGSRSKQRKFAKRLAKKGFTTAEIADLTCPIGLPMVHGKKPAEIAIAVAAQLLALKNQPPTPPQDSGQTADAAK